MANTKGDVSNTTVAVVLAVAILVSIVGIWVAVDNWPVEVEVPMKDVTTQGTVKLNIVDGSAPKQVSTATGNIALNIIN